MECDALCEKYRAALAAAKYPSTGAISVTLTPLLPTTPGLQWNNGMILMGTWTQLKPFEKLEPGQSFQLTDATWWTAVPLMQQWCQQTGLKGADLSLRIAQMLGMPPPPWTPNDGFIQVWVNPQNIFRPCPDPEISDHECEVQIPMVPPYVPAENQPPWACSGIQTSLKYVDVAPAHLKWMCANWTASYNQGSTYSNYPWTGLGYTYDWGSDNHVGQSEFVSPKNTTVIFESRATTDAYCTTSAP